MLEQDQIDNLIGRDIYGSDGSKIGTARRSSRTRRTSTKMGTFPRIRSKSCTAITTGGGYETSTSPGTAASGFVGDRDDTTARSRSEYDESRDSAGLTTDDAMTVSQERLNVGTERREAGRARLRKYVVTENVTQTVPVQREEVRVEREPITEGNRDAAMSGQDISGSGSTPKP